VKNVFRNEALRLLGWIIDHHKLAGMTADAIVLACIVVFVFQPWYVAAAFLVAMVTVLAATGVTVIMAEVQRVSKGTGEPVGFLRSDLASYLRKRASSTAPPPVSVVDPAASAPTTRYFVTYGDFPEREVTKREFVLAERMAGFHNTMGQPYEPATASFGSPLVSGRTSEVIPLQELQELKAKIIPLQELKAKISEEWL
jgi:hypothetical protein